MGVFEFILGMTGVIVVFIYLMARMEARRSGAAIDQDETELIQELHQGLQRMERRIETLETLLSERMDRRSAGESQWR